MSNIAFVVFSETPTVKCPLFVMHDASHPHLIYREETSDTGQVRVKMIGRYRTRNSAMAKRRLETQKRLTSFCY